MRIELAEYAAIDAVLLLRGKPERRRRVEQALRALGIGDRDISSLRRGDRMDAVRHLRQAFAGVSEQLADRLDTIRAAVDPLEHGIMPSRAATRLRALGIPVEAGIVLSQAMGQAVNLHAGDATATVSVRQVLADAATGAEKQEVVVEIHLPEGVMWRQESGKPEAVRIDAKFPATVLNALPGSRVDTVFEHRVIAHDPPIIDVVAESGRWTLLLLKAA